MKPIVLLTNDDGMDAIGIQILRKKLSGHVDLWIIAPDRERSASSHAITLRAPLRAFQIQEQSIALTGTPADCVYFGIYHALPQRPHLVISGINHGMNIGEDIFYSGTIAAAEEGALNGIPSLAVSLQCGGDWDWAAQWTLRIVQKYLEGKWPEKTLWSLNFPAHPNADPQIKLTHLGTRIYHRQIQPRLDPRGKTYYWLGGGEIGYRSSPGSDVHALEQGDISLTPIDMNRTRPLVPDLKAFWEDL